MSKGEEAGFRCGLFMNVNVAVPKWKEEDFTTKMYKHEWQKWAKICHLTHVLLDRCALFST